MWMLIFCIITTYIQVLDAAETGGKRIRDECKKRIWHDDKGQKCLASNGKPCHFPFSIKDKQKGKETIQL